MPEPRRPVNLTECLTKVITNPNMLHIFREIIAHSSINNNASALLSKYSHWIQTKEEYVDFINFLRILKSDVLLREPVDNVDYFNITPMTPLNRYNLLGSLVLDNKVNPIYSRQVEIEKILAQYSDCGATTRSVKRTPRHDIILNCATSAPPLETKISLELLKQKMTAVAILELTQPKYKQLFAKLEQPVKF